LTCERGAAQDDERDRVRGVFSLYLLISLGGIVLYVVVGLTNN
jgi:hypothetical protein